MSKTLTPQVIETDRVSNPEIMIDGVAVQAETDVKVELLRFGETPRAAAIE